MSQSVAEAAPCASYAFRRCCCSWSARRSWRRERTPRWRTRSWRAQTLSPTASCLERQGKSSCASPNPLTLPGRKLGFWIKKGDVIDRQPFGLSQDRRQARLPVGLPGPGIYTVTWRTASTVDQHTYEGFFTFTLGPLRLGGFALKGGMPSGPSAWEIAARWLMFLGAAVLGGGLLAHRYILAGAIRRSGIREDTLLSLQPRWRLASRLAVGLFLLGAFGERASRQTGRPRQPASPWDQPWYSSPLPSQGERPS